MGNTNKTRPCKRRLKHLEDVRRFLADLINRCNRDEVEPAKASKLGYLCQILARIIEGGDLERRLSDLETIIKKNDL